MCEHIFQVVREPHQAIREFVVELRCVHCAARKYVEMANGPQVEVGRRNGKMDGDYSRHTAYAHQDRKGVKA